MLCIYTFYNYTKLCRGGGLLTKSWKGVFILEARLPSFSGMKNMFRAGVHKLSQNLESPRHSRRQKGYTEDPQLLGANVQYFVVRVTWLKGFVHPCVRIFLLTGLMRMCKFSHVKIFSKKERGNIYIYVYLLVFPPSPGLLCFIWHSNNYFSVLCMQNKQCPLSRCYVPMCVCYMFILREKTAATNSSAATNIRSVAK